MKQSCLIGIDDREVLTIMSEHGRFRHLPSGQSGRDGGGDKERFPERSFKTKRWRVACLGYWLGKRCLGSARSVQRRPCWAGNDLQHRQLFRPSANGNMGLG